MDDKAAQPQQQGASRSEAVDHPSHYTRGRIETIEVIEDWGLGFCLGNTVKYISRAGHKDPAKTIEDLKKARWYLNREITRLELRNASAAPASASPTAPSVETGAALSDDEGSR